ncbi:type IV secretory system conjugative DNA transfer family protein, partial [Frankia sp. Cj3]|uniref:type IV secretory system conjugative DNA transfer family protein n=1 Tax=Frankia sp. Cj3 TaxID=2880976 RepID=UPI001EF536CA
RWMDFHGFALPVSPTAGPHILADDRASGFAHTPLGAALAAINIGFRTGSSVSPFVFEPTIEDVAVAVMAPRAGKTTALAVPVILDAPGAVVATANKADLWATTAALRAATGTVWVFDPQQIAYAPPIWWWNPLAAVRGVEDADRLASHFLQEIRGGQASRDFWAAAAGDLLASLLLAAAT